MSEVPHSDIPLAGNQGGVTGGTGAFACLATLDISDRNELTVLGSGK
jgi:hypothetical protein